MKDFNSEMEKHFGIYPKFIYKERNRKHKSLVCGIGYNDSPFEVQPTCDGKKTRHPAYSTWASMLNRCYNPKYKQVHPTYVGCTCCTDWLIFTTFAMWFKDNFIDGYQLDKDLLVRDNKIYGPSTCIFVPQGINKFLTLSNNGRGIYPLGVTTEGSKYISSINNGTGTPKYLGSFTRKEEAHKAWQKAKLEQAIAFNFPPLQRVIDQLKFEIENNLETTSL